MYAIYNRRRRDFTLDSTIDYLDNLALAVLGGQISTAADAADWIERSEANRESRAKQPASAGPSAAR